MKIQRSILLVLMMSALVLQGCSGGTWFPKTKAPARQHTRWNNKDRVSSLEETGPMHGEEDWIRYTGHPYNRDLRSVSKEKR